MSERITPLRRRLIEDMTVSCLSHATQASYVHAAKKLGRHYGRSPEHVGVEDGRTYQVLLVESAVALATLNQIVSALRQVQLHQRANRRTSIPATPADGPAHRRHSCNGPRDREAFRSTRGREHSIQPMEANDTKPCARQSCGRSVVAL